MAEKLIKQFYAACSDGKLTPFVKYTGILGQALSSIAFISSILTNDEIPKKQKGFLAVQEGIEGGISIGFICLLTSKMKEFGELLVDDNNQKMFPAFMRKIIPRGDDIKKNLSFANSQKLANFNTKFPEFAGFGGSLLATCIATPIIKNIISTGIYKINEKKEVKKIEHQNICNFNTLKKQSLPIDKYITKVNSPRGMKI